MEIKNQAFDIDLQSALLSLNSRVSGLLAGDAPLAHSTPRTRTRLDSKSIMFSTARAPRVNEILLSMNGSPIEVGSRRSQALASTPCAKEPPAFQVEVPVVIDGRVYNSYNFRLTFVENECARQSTW